ncbi:hypothetical protein LguiA_019230 [Lonicera macranthoides]
MVTLGYLHIQPSELKLPFELRKQSSCSMQLTNKTDEYIAFKVKTTHPKKYCVRPNVGVILPGMVCNVTVTMQAQKELPHDMHCKDKFLIQSVVAPKSTTYKDITSEMFTKRDGKVIEEFKLRVVYIPANPPSPIPEESEESYSPRSFMVDNENQNAPLVDALTRALEEPEEPSSSQTWSMISMLTEEKASAIQQNQKLQQELEVLRKENKKRKQFDGVSMMVVLIVALLGVLVGHLINKT